METLIIASLITAFVAGVAALFAPCCITVLLPSYLGSIFRERRKVLLMTFVFFLGLLAVFLPLGLGVAGLGQLLSKYHDPIFIVGGIFLAILGVSILLGWHFSMPFSGHSKLKIASTGSVFMLGIFSGIATMCCAPVLAGVIALSVLPNSIFWGGLYSLAYVLGMVAPLFLIAYLLDKNDFSQKLMESNKRVSYSIGGKKIHLSIADLVSGATFLLMGIFILYLAKTNQLAMGGGEFQTKINIYLNQLVQTISGWLK
ncbi:MAG: cytochrome c biogenesis protein CcdA [Candidatus Woesebacteria bacterium]|nr:cytochrome c biogenesis protein CcdA [Candidatus Woesebacteria bacterium]